MNLGLIKRRAAQKSLPYDAEVEYLKTSGDGTCIRSFDLSIDVNFRKEFSFKLEHTNGLFDMVCGCFTPTTFSFWTKNDSSFVVNFGGKESVIISNILVRNKITKVIAQLGFVTFEVDNQQEILEVSSIGTNVTSMSWGVFSNKTDRKGVISVYYYKIWDNNDNLILDLIPVRKDNVGYMYDRISGKLFGSDETGVLIYGPDK